jgi:hypothetical protein
VRDAFSCVGDQSTHSDTRLSKQRAACSSTGLVTAALQNYACPTTRVSELSPVPLSF